MRRKRGACARSRFGRRHCPRARDRVPVGSGQATLARTVRSGAIGEPRLADGAAARTRARRRRCRGPTVVGRGVRAAAAGSAERFAGDRSTPRATLGELSGVSAALPHVAPSTRTADDAFVVQFETRSGCAGVMQSTAVDWGPPVMITRVRRNSRNCVDRGRRREGQDRRSRRHPDGPRGRRPADGSPRAAAARRPPHRRTTA